MFRAGGDSCENDKAEIVKQQLAERFIHCLDDKKKSGAKIGRLEVVPAMASVIASIPD